MPKSIKVNKLIIISIFLCFSIQSIAQELKKYETALTYLNNKFDKNIQININKKEMMTMDFYKSPNKYMYRTDEIYLMTIDTNKIYYSKDENAIIMRCRKDLSRKWRKFNGRCVEKHLYKLSEVNASGRSIIKADKYDKKTVNGIIKALTFVVKTKQNENFKGATKFE